MAITKNDCLLLLTKMQDEGIEVKPQIHKLIKSPSLSLEVLKFINDHRQLDITNFYEYIRNNYNKKKSNLYINIMKEIEEPDKAITTLSALLTQIILASKHVEDKKTFLKNARANEITQVLNNYFNTYDIKNALNLLHLFKCDIKALESLK